MIKELFSRSEPADADESRERTRAMPARGGRLLPRPRGRLLLARPILYGVLAQICAVALMAVSGWLLSRAAQHPPVLYLMTTIVAVRALGIGRGVFRYQERVAGHDVALRLQSGLRVRAFRRLAGGAAFRRSGDLLSRLMNDIDAVQDLIVRVIVPVASTALVIAATSVAIALISWPAGLFLLAGSLLAGVLLPWLATVLSAGAQTRVAPLRSRLAEQVDEISRARLDLAAYGATDQALARVAATDAELAAAERRSAYASGLVAAIQWLSTGGVIIASMLVGGHAVAEQGLSPVYLAVLALTPLALHEVVAAMPAAALSWQRTRSSLTRVTELLRRGPEPVEDTSIDSGPLVLRARDLAAGWPGSPAVITHFDLELRAGERVALVGPSGRGKSTIAETMMGFIPARGGQLAVPERIGYLAQDAHVFDTTVAENVRIGGRDADDDQVAAALRSVGLAFSMDRMVGEYGTSISGGEARRLALARLELARQIDGEPELLIVDEPTEHLDQPTAAEITALILRAGPATAVLVITHDPALMQRCDRVVDLNEAGGPQSDYARTAAVSSGR